MNIYPDNHFLRLYTLYTISNIYPNLYTYHSPRNRNHDNLFARKPATRRFISRTRSFQLLDLYSPRDHKPGGSSNSIRYTLRRSGKTRFMGLRSRARETSAKKTISRKLHVRLSVYIPRADMQSKEFSFKPRARCVPARNKKYPPVYIRELRKRSEGTEQKTTRLYIRKAASA